MGAMYVISNALNSIAWGSLLHRLLIS